MKRQKFEKKHSIGKIILGIFLLLGILAFSQVVIFMCIHNLMVENILSWISMAIAIVLSALYQILLEKQRIQNRWKQATIISVIGIVILFVATFSMMFYQLNLFSTAMGKNTNVGYYSHNNTDLGSTKLKSLMQLKCKNAKGQEVERIDLSDYHEVIYNFENNFVSYEFVEENGRYYYVGTRKLVYQDAIDPTASYSWKQTVYADAKESTISHSVRLFQDGDHDPAWGVTSFDPRKRIRIYGKYPDKVTNVKMKNGTTVYLWMYKNLGNSEHLKLKDIQVD